LSQRTILPMAPPGNENVQFLHEFRTEKASGKIVKRFQDEFYAFDLLRVNTFMWKVLQKCRISWKLYFTNYPYIRMNTYFRLFRT